MEYWLGGLGLEVLRRVIRSEQFSAGSVWLVKSTSRSARFEICWLFRKVLQKKGSSAAAISVTCHAGWSTAAGCDSAERVA